MRGRFRWTSWRWSSALSQCRSAAKSGARLNYRDLAVLWGSYLPDLPLPYVPVSDTCGMVKDIVGSPLEQRVHLVADW